MKPGTLVWILFGSLLLNSLVVHGAWDPDADPALVAYYPLDGDATDSSGNGNDGTLNGPTPDANRFGGAGGAYLFDGIDDYLDTPFASQFSTASASTFTMWIKSTELCAAGTGTVFGVKDDSAAPFSEIYFEKRDGTDGDTAYTKYTLYHDQGAPGNDEIIWQNNSLWDGSIADGNWHMLSVVHESGYGYAKMHVYVDGVENTSHTLQRETLADQGTLTQSIYFGAKNEFGSPSFHLNASLDDIRVYSRALSGTEISELYELERVRIFVKGDASGSNNGTSWADAYTDLQSALSTASAGDEIWVAAGAYTPTTGSDRTISFQLTSDVAVYGGFAGTETARDQRDWKTNTTILSGDINSVGVDSDNSYHVVQGTNNATLDGFTIRDGYADAMTPNGEGAGMRNQSVVGLTVGNCAFVNNTVWAGAGYDGYGGAVYNKNVSTSEFHDCKFLNNFSSSVNGGGYGGAVYNDNAPATFERCVFAGNSASSSISMASGGAVYNFSSAGSFINCLFVGNLADGVGGAFGGAFFNDGSSSNITNCTITGNNAISVGSSYGGAVRNSSASNAVLLNTILWGNTAGSGGSEISNASSTPTASYCDVEGALNGTKCDGDNTTDNGGNISSDPTFPAGPSGNWTANASFNFGEMTTTFTDSGASWTADELVGKFINPDTSAYQLQYLITGNTANTITVLGDASIVAASDPYQIYNFTLYSGSPCVDAGTGTGAPTDDLNGDSRPIASGYDIGAFEDQNNPPTGGNDTVTATEDTTYAFGAGDFTYSDPDSNAMAGIVIDSLPLLGNLYDNASPVAANDVILQSTIDAGLFTFVPNSDEYGAGYAGFSFRVRDALGAVSLSSYAMTIDVNGVNDPPTGGNGSAITDEDVAYTFSDIDFSYSDPESDPMGGIKITALPSNGTLELSGSAVVLNQEIGKANIDAGLFKYVPDADGNGTPYDSFNFQVQDNLGGESVASYAMSIDVNAVNDGPTGMDNTVSTNEDTGHTFAAGDFPYSDSEGDPMGAVKVVSLPGSGTLKLNGIDVLVNEFILKTDLDGGLFEFLPVSQENGSPYATFDFELQDDVGDFSPSSYTMTINVLPVNDPPTLNVPVNVTVHDLDGEQNLGLLGIDDGDGGTQTISITAVSDTPAVIPDPIIDYTSPNSFGTLRFTPQAGQTGVVTITITIADDGGTANGGVDQNSFNFKITVIDVKNPNLVNDSSTGASSSSPQNLTEVGGALFFSADDGVAGRELWISDGQPYGTLMLKDINPTPGTGSFPQNLTGVGGLLFFSADDGTVGEELWRSDGTPGGTAMVKDINPFMDSMPRDFVDVNGTLFFIADDGTNGEELWKSDGSDVGTVMVKDIYSGASGSIAGNLVNVNGTLFFTADDGTNGQELWKSDGTEVGTVMVKDIYPGLWMGSDPGNLVDVNGTLFFSADDGTNGRELWKSDGTEVGTVMVKDIYPGLNSGDPTMLTDVNGILFFKADDGTNGYELWKSDGTEVGTVMVKDIYPGASWGDPISLANVNGVLYFSADDGTNGYELWKSDGTEVGTTLVKDIYPGASDSLPAYFTAAGGLCYFTADDGTNGLELWVSDGTTGGTEMLVDIYPGSNPSSPGYLTFAYPILYFAADDGVYGYELWKYDVNMPPTGLPKTASISEDTTLIFTPADFGFSDPEGHDFKSVVVVTIPANGVLQFNGMNVNPGDEIPVPGGIDAGKLEFLPVANEFGAPYASFDFAVKDEYGAKSETSYAFTINVDPVNDQPVSADASITLDEDATHVFAVNQFPFADLDVGDTLSEVEIAQLPAKGALTNNGAPVTVNQIIPVVDIQNGLLQFVPVANEHGAPYTSFQFNVGDGNTGWSGVHTMTINVNSINDVPVSADAVVTLAEDASHVFALNQFPFTDADPGDPFTGITITQLPARGAFTNNGTPVILNQVIPATDVQAGKLVFAPAANEHGTPYATLQFKVGDGQGAWSSVHTLTINVNSVNDVPVSADAAVTLNEDGTHVFALNQFPFSDADPGDPFAGITVTQLPAKGAFTNNGTTVTLNQVIPAADVQAGKLVFAPTTNEHGTPYATLQFKVGDGQGAWSSVHTLTINVNSVNDVPASADAAVTLNEDGTHVFALNQFPFSDADPGDPFAGITVTQLPAKGAFTNNGTTVTLNQVIPAADVQAGKLIFTPVANENGTPYATLQFKVGDGNGAWSSVHSMTINVNAVNDPPSASDGVITMSENATRILTAADFNFVDVDAGDALKAVMITKLPTKGDLRLNGTVVNLNQIVAKADIDAGNLRFIPTPNEMGEPYATIEFKVQDAGDAWSGVHVLTFNVSFVNDPPKSADFAVSMPEDETYAFKPTDVPFSDMDADDSLGSIQFTVLPAKGTLALSGVEVSSGQVIPAGDLSSLTYAPVTDENGAPYAYCRFKVSDSRDAWSVADYQATINVTPVSDPPKSADLTLTTKEDADLIINSSVFSFEDVDAGAVMAAALITSPPDKGALLVDDTVVVAGQTVPVADMDADKLIFRPEANASGSPYASFSFRVVDDEGAPSVNEYAATINVLTVNAPPTIDQVKSLDLIKNSSEQMVELSGITDGDDGSQTLTITAESDNMSVIPTPTVSYVSPESTGSLRFTPEPDQLGQAIISITVTDDGGVENDGVNKTVMRFTIQVTDRLRMVKDVNPGPADAEIQYVTKVGERLFFRADDGTSGPELWRSDGTTAGTSLVGDLAAGAAGSFPYQLTDVNGTLFFTASDGTHGYELWKSNGFASGTNMVKDVFPGASNGSPYNVTKVRGDVFFAANDGVSDNALWKSDGSSEGTEKIMEFESPENYPTCFADFNGELFFNANDDAHGFELWRSDGTSEGTKMLKDINPGAGHGDPLFMTAGPGALFLCADDGKTGHELWSVSDEVDVSMVKDIKTAGGSMPCEFVVVGDVLFFAANDGGHGAELWKSDGTPEGTTLVKDLNPGGGAGCPESLTEVNGRLCFAADDGVHGLEPWVSDGTPAGTYMLMDVNPGVAGSSPAEFTILNDVLYFRADDGEHGSELWSSEGTASDTRMVFDILPGPQGSYPNQFHVLRSSVFFIATDGEYGRELWEYTPPGLTKGRVTLAVNVEPENAGVVLPATDGMIQATAGDAVKLFAQPRSGFVFDQWILNDSGCSIRTGEIRGASTMLAITGDASVTARFAAITVEETESSRSRIKFRVEDGALKRHMALLKNMPLPETCSVETFKTEDVGRLTLDGVSFNFENGNWTLSRGAVWCYEERRDVQRVTLEIDLNRGEWSFQAKGVDLTDLDNDNGIDVKLDIGDDVCGGNFEMTEKTKWSFNRRKGDVCETVSGEDSGALSEFSIQKASGRLDDSNPFASQLSVDKASVAIPDAVRNRLLAGGAIYPKLTFDSMILVLNDVVLEGDRLTAADAAAGLTFTLDLDENEWSLKVRKIDADRINLGDGLAVSLELDGHEGRVILHPRRFQRLDY